MQRPTEMQRLAGHVVSGVFHNWLETEVRTSSSDRNSYLDDFDEMRHRITLGYDHDENWSAKKNKSHLDRLPVWWEAFAQEPADDEQAAKVLFAGLMSISGIHRVQSYIQSRSHEEYLQTRAYVGSIGIRRPVMKMVVRYVPENADFEQSSIDIDFLDRRRQLASKQSEETFQVVSERLAEGYDLGEVDSPSVNHLRKAGNLWLEFATSCVILAAKTRNGNLSNVPLLEAKSISRDPQIKPFFSVRTS